MLWPRSFVDTYFVDHFISQLRLGREAWEGDFDYDAMVPLRSRISATHLVVQRPRELSVSNS